jgi:ABC-type amino acid transport substrate-binding protein
MRAFLLLVSLAAVALTQPSFASDELTGTLKKVRDTGAITLGYRESSIPFSFLNPVRRPIGYSIDLCNEIVDEISAELGGREIEVRYKPVTSENRIPVLLSGEIDLECGSTTSNHARQKDVAFSPIFFVAGTKLLVKRGSHINSLRDLRGKTVVVTAGTTNEAAIRAIDEKQKLGIKLTVAKDHADSYARVTSGAADAFATDDVLLYGLIATSKSSADYKVVGEYLSYDPYGLMYRKADPDLADIVDRTFQHLAETRELVRLYNRWFQMRLPTGEQLGIPMSPQLEEIFHLLGLPD